MTCLRNEQFLKQSIENSLTYVLLADFQDVTATSAAASADWTGNSIIDMCSTKKVRDENMVRKTVDHDTQQICFCTDHMKPPQASDTFWDAETVYLQLIAPNTDKTVQVQMAIQYASGDSSYKINLKVRFREVASFNDQNFIYQR